MFLSFCYFQLLDASSQIKVGSQIQTCVWTRTGFQPFCAQSRTLFKPIFALRDRHQSRFIRHKQIKYQLKNSNMRLDKNELSAALESSRTLFDPMLNLRAKHRSHLIRHKKLHNFQTGSVYFPNQKSTQKFKHAFCYSAGSQLLCVQSRFSLSLADFNLIRF